MEQRLIRISGVRQGLGISTSFLGLLALLAIGVSAPEFQLLCSLSVAMLGVCFAAWSYEEKLRGKSGWAWAFGMLAAANFSIGVLGYIFVWAL